MTNPPKILHKTDFVLIADNSDEKDPTKPVRVFCKRTDVMNNVWFQEAETHEMWEIVNSLVKR